MRAQRSAGIVLCAFLLTSCPPAIMLEQLVHAKDKRGPTIAITSPADRSCYGSTVTVEGTVTDDASVEGDGKGVVVSLEYEVTDSRHSGDIEITGGEFSFSFSTLDLVGDQQLELRGTDWNGNLSHVTLTLRDDTTGPAISITSPLDQSEYRRHVWVEGRVSDTAEAVGEAGEVASLQYEVMTTTIGEEVEFAEDGSFSFEFLTDGLSSDLAVKVTAVDRLGDVTERTVNLRSDQTGPYVVITSPEDGGYYAKTVVLAGTVSDSEAEPGEIGEVNALSYEVLGTASAGELSFDASGAFSLELSTAGFEGPKTIRVTAEDWNTQTSEASVTMLDAGNDIPSFAAEPGNHEVTVSWDPVPLATSYTLYYTTNGSLPSPDYGESMEDVSSPLALAEVFPANSSF